MPDFPPRKPWPGPPPESYDDQTRPKQELIHKLGRAIAYGGGLMTGFAVLSWLYWRLLTRDGMSGIFGWWWATQGYVYGWLAVVATIMAFLIMVMRTSEQKNEYDRRFREWDSSRVAREIRQAEAEAQARIDRENFRRWEAWKAARDDREQRLATVESRILRAFVTFSLEANFAGGYAREAVAAAFMQRFVRTDVPDLGLLRESQNENVRGLIGDGSLLPIPVALPPPPP